MDIKIKRNQQVTINGDTVTADVMILDAEIVDAISTNTGVILPEGTCYFFAVEWFHDRPDQGVQARIIDDKQLALLNDILEYRTENHLSILQRLKRNPFSMNIPI